MVASRACDEAAQYKRVYGEPIPGHVLTERVGSYVHLFNLYWSLRWGWGGDVGGEALC